MKKATIVVMMLSYMLLLTESCQNAPPSPPKTKEVQTAVQEPLKTKEVQTAVQEPLKSTTEIQVSNGSFKPQNWYFFRGQKAGKKLQLTFHVNDNQEIEGRFMEEDNESEIRITGKIQGAKVTFQGVKPSLLFNGTINDNVMQGKWEEGTPAKTTDLTFQMTSSNENKSFYQGTKGSAESIEGFMKQVRTAILTDDAKWLSDHLSYPRKVNIEGKSVEIQNKTEFVKQFSKICHPAFKTAVKGTFPIDLAVRQGKIRLGSGQIWIEPIADFTESHAEYKIVVINN